MLNMDVAFLALLFLTSLTGLVLLACRRSRGDGNAPGDPSRRSRGPVHHVALWEVLHVVYRYALERYSIEQRRAEAQAS